MADVRQEDEEVAAPGEDDTAVVPSAGKKRKAVPGNEKTRTGKKMSGRRASQESEAESPTQGVKQRDLQQRRKRRLRQEGVHLERSNCRFLPNKHLPRLPLFFS